MKIKGFACCPIWEGNLDQAIRELTQALIQKPTYAKAHYNLGLALERKSSLQTALVQFRLAYELGATPSDLYSAVWLSPES